MINRTLPARIALLVCIGLFTGLSAQAQSVDAVISKMKAQYEQQLAAVDTYIIETDKYTTYHRKVTADGSATYESRTQWKDSEHFMGGSFMGDMNSTMPSEDALNRLAENATYGGTETIDGVQTHVLIVDDPSALSDEMMDDDSMDMPANEEDDNIQVGSMRFYVHADMHVPVRMDYDATVTREDGSSQKMNSVVTFTDYRTVDGLTLPYQTMMRMDNLNASISPEDREEARKSLEEMEKKMKEMGERQRKMMERMMGGQMDKLRQIIEEGTIEYTIQVQDVQVNASIPDDVFTSTN
jgi:hypothetical protein